MRLKLLAVFATLPLIGAHAAEDGHKELGAHAHGHGTFNMAIEGNKVAMELESPGADIVGFEHKAKTKAQKKALKNAKNTLSDLTNVVNLPADAGCTLKTANIEFHVEEAKDDHDHDHGHAKKKDDHDHDHDHAKKKDDHDHGHAKKKDDHDHDHDHGKKKDEHARGRA